MADGWGWRCAACGCYVVSPNQGEGRSGCSSCGHWGPPRPTRTYRDGKGGRRWQFTFWRNKRRYEQFIRQGLQGE